MQLQRALGFFIYVYMCLVYNLFIPNSDCKGFHLGSSNIVYFIGLLMTHHLNIFMSGKKLGLNGLSYIYILHGYSIVI